MPKGQAQGAKREGWAARRMYRPVLCAQWALTLEAKDPPATPLVVAFLAKSPALASSRASIGPAGEAFAFAKIG